MAQWVKKPPKIQETQQTRVWFLGQKDLEKEMATLVFLPGNPMDRGPLWAIVQIVTELDPAED